MVIVAPTVERPRRRRPSCCCLGCLVMVLLVVLAVGGVAVVGWRATRRPPSPVDLEYREVPDYFPPESSRLGEGAG